MAKAAKKSDTKQYAQKVAIKGTFLDVFKVVKKDKARRAKEDKKKP